MLTPLGQKQH